MRSLFSLLRAGWGKRGKPLKELKPGLYLRGGVEIEKRHDAEPLTGKHPAWPAGLTSMGGGKAARVRGAKRGRRSFQGVRMSPGAGAGAQGASLPL